MINLHPDYRLYLDAQTHLKTSSVETRERILSKVPPPDELTVEWWRNETRRIAPKTAQARRSIIFQALRFLGREDLVEELRKVKLARVPDSVTVEDLYTKEEIKLIFQHCQHTRDRAMLQVLYEGALRAGELLSMKFDNVEFREDGTATIIVSGKTGTRQVPLFASVPALKEWMNHHSEGNGHIWVRLIQPFKQITWSGLYLCVQTVFARAQITDKKKLVHMFRHTRITELVKLGIRGQILHKLVGWTKRSNMEAVYVHLSTADVENEVRVKAFGLAEDEERYEPIIKPIKCPRCENTNEPQARYCKNCNMPIADDAIVKALQQQERKREEIEQLVQERVNESTEEIVKAFTTAIQNIKSTKTLRDFAIAFAREMNRDSND